MKNLEGRYLLAWLMCRGAPGVSTRWKDRVVFAQQRFGVALSTAQAIASVRIGKWRAVDIRRLAQWDGRQGELLEQTPPIGQNDAASQDALQSTLFQPEGKDSTKSDSRNETP